MTLQIFISHAAIDRIEMETLRTQAQAVGVSTYAYEHDPRPGEALTDKLRAAIASSDALVVLLTTGAAASKTVQQEIGIAVGLGKPVIPLVEEGVGADGLALLAGLEYVRFDRTAPSEALAALTAVLQRMTAAKRADEASQRADDAAEERRRERQRELALALAVVGALVLLALLAKSS